jgi:hypothetical protein
MLPGRGSVPSGDGSIPFYHQGAPRIPDCEVRGWQRVADAAPDQRAGIAAGPVGVPPLGAEHPPVLLPAVAAE